jgi:hypothetical protein
MMDVKERRSYPRTFVDWPAIVLTQQGCIGGEAKNISPSGAFIHCLTEPGQNGPLRVIFSHPLRDKLLLVGAELAWSNISNCDDIDSCGIGVQFTKLFSHGHLVFNKIIS